MKNLTESQRNSLKQLLSQDDNTKGRWHDRRGVTAVMQGKLLPVDFIEADPAKDPGTGI